MPAGQAGSTAASRSVAHPDAPDEPLSPAPADEAPAASAPKADAGPDRIVWIGWDEIVLSGSGTGEKLTYWWKQLRGPTSLKIGNPRREVTVARGFRLGADMSWNSALYAFELTVTDAHGQQATDTVEYVVLAAPDLTITPTPRRHFALRDGYWLAHFDGWATDIEGNQFTFRIAAPTTVTFTKIGGGSHDLAVREVAGKYTYEVTLYAQPGEVSSWVEFLIDTADKVPGIVQLGVSWNGR